VVVPLRQALRRTLVRVGSATGVDLDRRTCTYVNAGGVERSLGWDRLVVALGSVSRRFPIPGLAEHASGFKTLAEAIHLRNLVLERLELADASDDPDERRARLGFVVVGAGYAGTELVAELGTLGQPEPCRPPSRPESGEGSGSERERGVDRRREVSACLSAKTKRSFQAP
jgi:NADH dehydrogenase